MTRKPKRKFMTFIRRPFVLGLLAVIVAAGLYWTLMRDNNNTQPPSENIAQTSFVNLDPPTEQDKQEVEAHKKQLAEQENSTAPATPQSTEKKQVTPIITVANTDRVSAYVTGIFEEGGICTATFTKGTQTIIKTSKGFQNVSYTSCDPIDPGAQVSGSDWTVVVSYNSASAAGKSQSKQVEEE